MLTVIDKLPRRFTAGAGAVEQRRHIRGRELGCGFGFDYVFGSGGAVAVRAVWLRRLKQAPTNSFKVVYVDKIVKDIDIRVITSASS